MLDLPRNTARNHRAQGAESGVKSALVALDAQTPPPAISAAPKHGGLASWQIRKITRHMEDNLDQTLGLQGLAALVGLSRCHFCTAFRQTIGHAPGEWLTAMRLRRACDLLLDSTQTVTQIALAVGYQTPSAFAHAFKKVFGATPSQYRRTAASRPPVAA